MPDQNTVAIVGVILGTVATLGSAAIASIMYIKSGCRRGESCCELQCKKKPANQAGVPGVITV